MAHYAQLDENNVVLQVIVVNNSELETAMDVQIQDGFVNTITYNAEAKGLEFIRTLYPADTVWKQTSYNGKFRGKYAAIGDTFDGTNFVSPVVPPAPPPEPTPEPTPTTATTVDSFTMDTGTSTVDSITIEASEPGA